VYRVKKQGPPLLSASSGRWPPAPARRARRWWCRAITRAPTARCRAAPRSSGWTAGCRRASPTSRRRTRNASSGSFELRVWDSAGRVTATRSSLRLGSFYWQGGWLNLSAGEQAGTIQAVGIELNKDENLSLCEIEMYGANGPGTNLLLSGGRATACP
jgi:hypothetical protein